MSTERWKPMSDRQDFPGWRKTRGGYQHLTTGVEVLQTGRMGRWAIVNAAGFQVRGTGFYKRRETSIQRAEDLA